MAATAIPRALRAIPASVLVLVALSACSGDETPAVCTDVDAVKDSVSALTDVKVEQGALTDLQDKLATVKQDVAKLKSDAKSEFSTQLDAVDSATSTFTSTLDAAVADPSVGTVGAVGPALESLGTALTDLESAVEKTC